MINLGAMTIPERQGLLLTAARGVFLGLLLAVPLIAGLPTAAGAQRDAMRMGEQFGTVVIKQPQPAPPSTPAPAAGEDALRPAENLQIEKKEKPR